jgi:hypothetical protein
MTQYMFMLFDDESWYDNITEESWQQAMRMHGDFAAAVEAAGARITGGDALLRTTTATTVRNSFDGGEPLVTDGPFLETKEALGGYYVLECRDLDQAIELAGKCPSTVIEIRPVMDTSQSSGPPA